MPVFISKSVQTIERIEQVILLIRGDKPQRKIGFIEKDKKR